MTAPRDQRPTAANEIGRDASSSNGERGIQPSAYEVVTISDVEAEPVHWLWFGRLPYGKVVVLDGDPGVAKSVMTLDWAARLSRGRPFPGESVTPPVGNTVILTAEDGIEDTVKPRCIAADADMNRIHCLRTVLTGVDKAGDPLYAMPMLPGHTGAIERVITDLHARLLVIDVLEAYVEKHYKVIDGQSMRAVLTPLAEAARRTGCCIVALRHLNKSPGLSALYRGSGAIGITGAARVALIAAVHPDDAEVEDPSAARRVLAVSKINIARTPPAITYRTVERRGIVAIEWGELTLLRADRLVGLGVDSDTDDTADFLREVLSAGPMLAKHVQAEGEAAGFSLGQLRRAKRRAAVRSDKARGSADGAWFWTLT